MPFNKYKGNGNLLNVYYFIQSQKPNKYNACSFIVDHSNTLKMHISLQFVFVLIVI